MRSTYLAKTSSVHRPTSSYVAVTVPKANECAMPTYQVMHNARHLSRTKGRPVILRLLLYFARWEKVNLGFRARMCACLRMFLYTSSRLRVFVLSPTTAGEHYAERLYATARYRQYRKEQEGLKLTSTFSCLSKVLPGPHGRAV